MMEVTQVARDEVHVTVEIEERSFCVVIDFEDVQRWAEYMNACCGDGMNPGKSREDVASILFGDLLNHLRYIGLPVTP